MTPFLILFVSAIFGYFIARYSRKELEGRIHVLRDASCWILLFSSSYIIYDNGLTIQGIIFLVFGYLVSEEKYSKYINQFCQGLISFTYAHLMVPVKMLEGSYKKRPHEYVFLLSYFIVPWIPNVFLSFASFLLMGISISKVRRSAKKWKNLSTYLSKQTPASRA